jgi:hypothetical protein
MKKAAPQGAAFILEFDGGWASYPSRADHPTSLVDEVQFDVLVSSLLAVYKSTLDQ